VQILEKIESYDDVWVSSWWLNDIEENSGFEKCYCSIFQNRRTVLNEEV
jgi:hypothetical protein